jgi:L-ascorbate metabolism protein UlaG (beta-lactamase superfamily)
MRIHIAALVAVVLWPLAGQVESPKIAVRYVANSGMLVTVSDRRFLIDAPIRDGISPYATSTPVERRQLESASAPYADVDAILATHWHEDHFSPEAVAAHLSRSPRTLFISSPEVVERLRKSAPGLPASQTRAVLPEPGRVEQVDIRGVPVRVLRIRHNPTRRVPEQHVGFLIGSDTRVLHVGDADPAGDNFALLNGLPSVDLALLPFWYVLDEGNRRFVAESIRPSRIVAMHVPPQDADKVLAALRAANVSAVVASVPGSPVTIR